MKLLHVGTDLKAFHKPRLVVSCETSLSWKPCLHKRCSCSF